MHFTNSVTIQRSPHDVFEYLANFENVPEWNYAIVETRKTSDGPVGVGTTYRQARSLPSPAEEAFEVTEFEPDRRLSIRGDLGPFKGTLTYDLESAPDGTRITNSADPSGTRAIEGCGSTRKRPCGRRRRSESPEAQGDPGEIVPLS